MRLHTGGSAAALPPQALSSADWQAAPSSLRDVWQGKWFASLVSHHRGFSQPGNWMHNLIFRPKITSWTLLSCCSHRHARNHLQQPWAWRLPFPKARGVYADADLTESPKQEAVRHLSVRVSKSVPHNVTRLLKTIKTSVSYINKSPQWVALGNNFVPVTHNLFKTKI